MLMARCQTNKEDLMYNVFDKSLIGTSNSYAQFFGDDEKPMVNTLQGPSEEEAECTKCEIK